MNKINLKWAWEYVTSLWYTPYYIGVYWSQNYNLHTEKSDVDYKCIILPTLEELVKNSKPISKSIDFESWLIDLKDIRFYVENAAKVNINFIEILSTSYFLWDEEIRKFFIPLIKNLPLQFIRCCNGMMNMKYVALSHPYPSKEYEIKTFGYDPKQLLHIVRLHWVICRYLEWNYSFLEIEENREKLLYIKSWKLSLKEAEAMASEYIEKTKKIINDLSLEENYEIKKEIIKFSQDVIYNNIKKQLT